MVSHDLKCIFVHVPKTAGKSVERFFLDHLGMDPRDGGRLLLAHNTDPGRGPHVLDHLTAAQYVACGHVEHTQFQSYFKFAFVRNPWDRVVSEYKYRGYPRRFNFKTYLFEHWPQPAWDDLYLHAIPQSDFVLDGAGKPLVDFVGKYEHLRRDFETVLARLGLPRKPLPHVNRSLARGISRYALAGWIQDPLGMVRQRGNVFAHYTEFYDDESREFIATRFRRDIETFGYEFGS